MIVNRKDHIEKTIFSILDRIFEALYLLIKKLNSEIFSDTELDG